MIGNMKLSIFFSLFPSSVMDMLSKMGPILVLRQPTGSTPHCERLLSFSFLSNLSYRHMGGLPLLPQEHLNS